MPNFTILLEIVRSVEMDVQSESFKRKAGREGSDFCNPECNTQRMYQQITRKGKTHL